MSDNSSSSGKLPLLHCSNTFTALLSLRGILLLPLSTFILFLALQRWRLRCYSVTSSLSDIFAYNLAVMELLWVFGFFCKIAVDYFNLPALGSVGQWAALNTYYGEISFHGLTCAERYIAVVHPVTYLRVRNTCWVRTRNISTSCVWLLCLFMILLNQNLPQTYRNVPFYSFLAFSVSAISFFSLSVLRVLIRPGPGDVGGDKGRSNQSKKRAFLTVTAILGAEWFWVFGLVVPIAVSQTPVLSAEGKCLVSAATAFCNLPSNLVLPLLYLHRVGKLPAHRINPE